MRTVSWRAANPPSGVRSFAFLDLLLTLHMKQHRPTGLITISRLYKDFWHYMTWLLGFEFLTENTLARNVAKKSSSNTKFTAGYVWLELPPYLREGWSQTGWLRGGWITIMCNSSDGRGGGMLSFICRITHLSGCCSASHTCCQTRTPILSLLLLLMRARTHSASLPLLFFKGRRMRYAKVQNGVSWIKK